MKKLIWIAATTTLATGTAMAQELGRVLSTSAVQRQVVVPQQVCHDESVPVRQRSSGAGAVIGAVVGGLAGNAIGSGAGRAAATGAGLVGGAMLGNQLESNGAVHYEIQRLCTTQNFYRNQTIGYDVVYEYAGRQYTTRTATPPGDWIALSVQPAPSYAPGYYSSESYVGATLPPATYATAPQPVYSYPEDTGYNAADYVAPMLLGATVAAGAHYVLRPRGNGHYRHHRPHHWRR